MPCVAHLMLVMVLNLPEQRSFQDLLFHLLFLPKSAEKFASRMDISPHATLIDQLLTWEKNGIRKWYNFRISRGVPRSLPELCPLKKSKFGNLGH